MTAEPTIAVVVPAHNAAWCLEQCLDGLHAAGFDLAHDVRVVDDGSRDGTSALAQSLCARLIHNSTPKGAAAARQAGAAGLTADVIVFVDSDVVVAPDTKSRLLAAFATSTDAVFGAYDDAPAGQGWVSQYRNLLHRFVHLTSAGPAQTFWTGLGAVRRTAYEAVGGIDPAQRMMEDVELGMRLHAGGHSILLDPDITGTHLKEWTWRSMIVTDLWDRAVPWTQLLVTEPDRFASLNLSPDRKAAALASAGAAIGALMAPFHWSGLAVFVVSVAAFAALSWPFLRWLAGLRGSIFAAFSILPHIVHNWCAVAGFAIVKIPHALRLTPLNAPSRPKG